MTTSPEPALAAVASVLAEHRLHDRRSDPQYPWCICGWVPDRGGSGNERIYYAHIAHVAAAILAATPTAAVELRPRHCTVDGCGCEQYGWNGRSSALKTDPPSTCTCGHPTSRHSFLAATPTAARTEAAEVGGEPRAMTLSHDRLILRHAERYGGGRIVVVRCPHTIGLAFDLDQPDGFLGMLPCPCNDRSEIVARVVPAS